MFKRVTSKKPDLPWWLDLAPGALIYFWCLKGGRLFGTGLISFLRNNRMFKRNLNIYLKTNSNRNCNSNKYWQLTWRTYLDNKMLGMWRWNFPSLYSPFLKKPAVRTKCQSRGLENGLVVPGSFLARMMSRAVATKFDEEIIRLKSLCIHMDIRPLFL